MILLMVVIGGITRLTESGLSITEWRPVTGVLPPLHADEWAAEFERYRQIPQYRAIHAEMTLGEFKDALEKAERYGVKDDDVLRVTTFMAFSEGAPVKRVYLPVDDDL